LLPVSLIQWQKQWMDVTMDGSRRLRPQPNSMSMSSRRWRR